MDNVKKGYDVCGNKREYIKMTRAAGKKYFIKLGFVQCLNPSFMESDEYYVHYNEFSKCWMIDKKGK